jgi:hypothetical protein
MGLVLWALKSKIIVIQTYTPKRISGPHYYVGKTLINRLTILGIMNDIKELLEKVLIIKGDVWWWLIGV